MKILIILVVIVGIILVGIVIMYFLARRMIFKMVQKVVDQSVQSVADIASKKVGQAEVAKYKAQVTRASAFINRAHKLRFFFLFIPGVNKALNILKESNEKLTKALDAVQIETLG